MIFSLHLKTTMKFDTLTIYHIKYINYYVQSHHFKNIVSISDILITWYTQVVPMNDVF